MSTRTSIFATNDVLTANDLNALAGAWNAYTPVLTGFTPGNGTATGAYLQFGKLVFFKARFTFGTTSAAASAGAALSLPVTATSDAAYHPSFQGFFYDTGSAVYTAQAAGTPTTVTLWCASATGQFVTPSTTTPFTWTTGDLVIASGFYEAA